jgi:hypothetical protein
VGEVKEFAQKTERRKRENTKNDCFFTGQGTRFSLTAVHATPDHLR